VDPAAATQLAFTAQPADVQLGSTLPPVVVTARDPFGNNATGFIGDVVMTIDHDGAVPPPATLGGTPTVAALSGVATFNDLTIDRSGVAYTLAANSGTLTGATSDPFSVISFATLP
jgi:hypothetical protein